MRFSFSFLVFTARRLTDLLVYFYCVGKIRKIRNHVTDFGSTGAMATTDSCLVSAGYDLDRGNGYLNGKDSM